MSTEAIKQWADDVSKAYDILAFGHTERAAEILAKTRNSLREALAEPQEKYIYGTPLLDAMTGKANEALDKKAENARELGLDYEMPITMQEGEFDCTHAERLCAELKAAHPATPCTHPSLGACSLREDGTASRWNCVMCGTEFVPKATNRWAEFNETTKRNIKHAEWYLSTHSNLSQQNPTAWILKCGEQQELWWEKPPFGDAIALYTSPQPAQQEPVAYMGTDIEGSPNKFRLNPFGGCVPLYKKPQSVKVWDAEGYGALCQELEGWKAKAQRKPLTDEEWQSIADTLDCSITRGQKDAIEAALGIKENT